MDKFCGKRDIKVQKDKYENIILVGHSMGGLLSILLSLKYKNKSKITYININST